MNYPKLFSQKSLLTWLLAALFMVALGALPAQAQPWNNGSNDVSVIDVAMSSIKSDLTLKFKLEARSAPGPITVELRSATAPFTRIDSVKGTGGGNVASVFSFEKAASGVPYYVVIKSANSIETWSATTITFNSNAASYDFTTNVSQAYGDNQKLSNGIACIFQGDVNQDGLINLSDLLQVNNASTNFETGNTPNDINNDGNTALSDITVVYNNANLFVEVKRP